jgi:hypothetical protein
VDELDRILSSEERLEPSSGFAAATLRAVQDAATEPPPLPFPWGRLVVGLAGSSALAVSGTVLALRSPSWTSLSIASLPAPFPQLAGIAPELGYAAITIVASLATLRVFQTFVRRTPLD